VLAAGEEVAAVGEHGVDEVGLAVAQRREEVVGADVARARALVADLEGEVAEEGMRRGLDALAELERDDDVTVVAAPVAAAVQRHGRRRRAVAARVLEELERIAEDVLRAHVALARRRLQQRGRGADSARVKVVVEDALGEALLLDRRRLAAQDLAVVEKAHVGVALVGLELHDRRAARAVGRVARLHLDQARVADTARRVQLRHVDDKRRRNRRREDRKNSEELEHLRLFFFVCRKWFFSRKILDLFFCGRNVKKQQSFTENELQIQKNKKFCLFGFVYYFFKKET
jgi:hypothetical protein